MTTTLSVIRTFVRESPTSFDLDLMVDATVQILTGNLPGAITIRLLAPDLTTLTAASYDGNWFRVARPATGGGNANIYNGGDATSLKVISSSQWADFVWTQQDAQWRVMGFGNL